jgi:hypothetical protein
VFLKVNVLPACEKSMIDHALTQMDSDNDDMTDDENDDPVAAHDEIGDLAFILVLTVWAKPKTEASLLHPAQW